MLKKLLMGAALAALMSGTAMAANVPLVSGPVDPSNQIATLNQVIQSVNGDVTGILAATPATAITTDTSADTLFAYTAPGGLLSTPGQLMHIHAWGVNSADANVKTVTFNYGAASCAVIVTGSGAKWFADFLLLKTAAATQTFECHGQQAATAITENQGTATNADSAATTVTVTGTAATSGTITLAGAYVEQLK